MNDDKGVLGNLPRSRPGTRSDKRGGGRPADAAEKAAKRSEPARPAAATARAKRAKATAKPPKREAPAAKPDPAAPERDADSWASDPITGAARTAAKAVEAGVKIGTGIAQEVLRRLPRP